MFEYSYEQVAIIVAIPSISIISAWTTIIFYKNRKSWGPYDLLVIFMLISGIIRNLTILLYILIITLKNSFFNLGYCSVLTWIFNSTHTFQACLLTTLAVIGLLSVRLNRKKQTLKHFLTTTHIIYHLFCLTTLCACVGVAALLARHDHEEKFKNITIFESIPCQIMPYELDVKYNVFVIALHVFLAIISTICFILVCYNILRFKKQAPDYMKKSNSDLSDISLTLNNNNNNTNNGKNYFDTYNIPRDIGMRTNIYMNEAQNQDTYRGWSSDMSNMSTTVSSTNSRRPCILKSSEKTHQERTGLETINSMLIICYSVYHIPLIVLCIYPQLLSPWPVAGAALWLGLLQDFLIPVSFGLVDSRFGTWVSNAYKCTRRKGTEKIPRVAPDGKFRPFSSQAQSLEIQYNPPQSNLKTNTEIEHRFPLTNGSLYTSIDGRLPILHNNYRRHKDLRGLQQDHHSKSNIILSSSHLRRNNLHGIYNSENYDPDLYSNNLNPVDLRFHNANHQVNMIHQFNMANSEKTQTAASNENLEILQEQPAIDVIPNHHLMRNSRNLTRLNKLELQQREDSLNNMNQDLLKNQLMKTNANKVEPPPKIQILDYSSSDDDYTPDIVFTTFDSLSSKSSYSITTEANGDFHFYQTQQMVDIKDKPELLEKCNNLNISKSFESLSTKNMYDSIHSTNSFLDPLTIIHCSASLQDFTPKNKINRMRNKIFRTHSKRSLENFQAFLEDREFANRKIKRSNSYMTFEDRSRICSNKKLLRSNSKSSECTNTFKEKNKSVEYLPTANINTFLSQNLNHSDCCNFNKSYLQNSQYIGSVPDLKRIFISEYI